MKGRVLLLVALLVVALVAVAACGGDDDGGDTTPAETPAATTPADGDGADGAAVFAANCSTCHAENGSGGIGPDLRGEDDVAGIETRVRNGAEGMPAFEGQLSDEEISAVSEYVTTL
jgi:cytochrome c551